ncbi:MAG: nucleotidyltransferase domain-containing protein [Betaproteobacteria bacterium]|nr:nucleotidyltransferase domain-containing protein [Betaproteobacteria bacterium]
MNHDGEIIATLCSALPDLLAIYRFGSHGTAGERAGSDIDLAVLGRALFDSGALWDLSQGLAMKLGREVDLLDLATASTVLQAQIVTHGERIFCSDPIYGDSYADYILSAYARLNEERRDILTDVLSRGSVYGS